MAWYKNESTPELTCFVSVSFLCSVAVISFVAEKSRGNNFSPSSLKIAMDYLKKSTVIVIAFVWASFSFPVLASGGGGSGSCKYTVLLS